VIAFQSILVPLDFSAHSDRALASAKGLAKTFGARLHLLHAYHLPVHVAMPDQIIIPQDFWTSVREAARSKLEEVRKSVAAEGIQVEAHLVEMPAAEAIQQAAERLGADLIVMGTRGLTGLKHVLLGSVAERTLRTARCPVLTVKAEVP
jgi:nucleotide-binding universal stress UspA family protein